MLSSAFNLTRGLQQNELTTGDPARIGQETGGHRILSPCLSRRPLIPPAERMDEGRATRLLRSQCVIIVGILTKSLTNHGVMRNPGMLCSSPSTTRRSQVVPNVKDPNHLYILKYGENVPETTGKNRYKITRYKPVWPKDRRQESEYKIQSTK